MKSKFVKGLAVMMIGALCLAGCGNKEVGTSTVTTDGSTSMEKVIGTLSESYMNSNQGIQVTYNPTGSGSGISAVENGTCDIGLSSRHLKDEELANGLVETTLANDGISVIVNTENVVDDLTVEQIAAIYTGEITNWSELGGNDSEIVVIGREAGSGTRDGFESITNTEDACKLRQELSSTGDVIATVKNNENTIGYASFASVDDSVKTISIDNVLPSTETISDGSYILQRPFVLVTKGDEELSEEAQKFFDYMLSEDAKDLILSAGVVPVE